MEAGRRRDAIVEMLERAGDPLTGSELARRLAVSRQVIVQDIAILRAGGAQILATPQGYLLARAVLAPTFNRTFAVRHDMSRLEEELLIMVDCGGKVLDVVVEHPLYGELRGLLMLSSRRNVTEFVARLRQTGARPLSALTGGVHLHTVEAPEAKVLDTIQKALEEAGLLLQTGK